MSSFDRKNLGCFWLIFSKSDYLIKVADTNSHSQTVQIQISWLQKTTDPGLHCKQRQGISGISRTRVKGSIFLKKRHFVIKERFNKLIYGFNTIIKCGT